MYALICTFINRVHIPCAVRKMRGGEGISAHESRKKESRMSVTNERVIRGECHEPFRLLILEISGNRAHESDEYLSRISGSTNECHE